jgi:hypothetical protein
MSNRLVLTAWSRQRLAQVQDRCMEHAPTGRASVAIELRRAGRLVQATDAARDCHV